MLKLMLMLYMIEEGRQFLPVKGELKLISAFIPIRRISFPRYHLEPLDTLCLSIFGTDFLSSVYVTDIVLRVSFDIVVG